MDEVAFDGMFRRPADDEEEDMVWLVTEHYQPCEENRNT